MREEPSQQIDRRAIRVWQLNGVVTTLVFAIITATLYIVKGQYNWPDFVSYITYGLAALTSIYLLVAIFVVPYIKWRRWRYQIYPHEIYVQRGLIIITRTVVPISRVQHVDTEQGPFLRAFKLSTVSVSTAATTHQIPALPVEEAEQLRDDIARLAGVDDDDE
ncbi:hypothetical protein DES38_106106 [Streptohalobacillus salinus]|uniref:YdbS-like PH domain-containing protein n=1 Tax=Streptohalobacillus salinus TaxID=621096 RepID=A0A2V3WQV7_9BACI|nr:PH domain-containing protein [Streptohalobacillus salinus]PXW91069.1 hypothetical protein DES38_106106 [Streptohalobacillus salinus]